MSSEPQNHSIPVNKLEELDLNNCVIEIKDLKFTYNKANGYLLDGFTMTFPRSAMSVPLLSICCPNIC